MPAKAAIKVMIALLYPLFQRCVLKRLWEGGECERGCCPRKEGASLTLSHSAPLSEQAPIPNHRQTLTVCKYHILLSKGSAFFVWLLGFFFLFCLSCSWTLWGKIFFFCLAWEGSCQKWNVEDEESLCDHLDRHIKSAEKIKLSLLSNTEKKKKAVS